MNDRPKTYTSKFGTHCSTCGSLAEACGDLDKCREDAQLWIEEVILSGNSTHPWLSTAHDMHKEHFPDKEERLARSRKATVQAKGLRAIKAVTPEGQ